MKLSKINKIIFNISFFLGLIKYKINGTWQNKRNKRKD